MVFEPDLGLRDASQADPATGRFVGERGLLKVVRNVKVAAKPLLHLRQLLRTWAEIPPGRTF
jgi:hypothetical protein